MKVLFRSDASAIQGTGHLMRCLVLADELRKRGHECVFITQPFLPDFLKQIADRKHRMILLQENEQHTCTADTDNEYLKWLGRNIIQDALETRNLLCLEKPDVIIADHYAINADWMKIVANQEVKTVIIDDLANREHFCDILVDQNFGRTSKQYKSLVSKKTKILAGAEYVFIKDRFKQDRDKIQLERLNRRPNCLNICMGGMDKDNATQRILQVVSKLDYFENWNIDVVLRSSSPNSGTLQEYVRKQKRTLSLYFDHDDMASLFSKADLAIGAGGVTLWERCCSGLPTVLLTIADNQVPAALAMKGTGAIIYSGDIRRENWEHKLSEDLKTLAQNSEAIHQMSVNAFSICDGNGLGRVCDVIERA